MEAAGLDYPPPGERAGRFAEAASIIRSLLHTGAVEHSGEFYRVNLKGLGPVANTPPPLVASVGGPRTIREVTPHCDRVELKAASAATRDGELDVEVLATVRDEDLVSMIDRVRRVDPDIELGMFVLCNAGDDAMTQHMATMLDDSLYGRFYGPADKIAEGFAWLGELGISRCQVSPISDTSLDLLAPFIFS